MCILSVLNTGCLLLCAHSLRLYIHSNVVDAGIVVVCLVVAVAVAVAAAVAAAALLLPKHVDIVAAALVVVAVSQH